MLLKSKRGRVRSGRNVIYWFLTSLQICCWHSEEKWEQLFFGDKIPHLESVFWKVGCVPVLRSLIRIMRASLVQIDTEVTKKYSNQRYAVDAVSTNTHMSNTARYSSRVAFFAYLTCIRCPSEYRYPVWYGKTRMVWLPDGEKNSKICLLWPAIYYIVNSRRNQTHRCWNL